MMPLCRIAHQFGEPDENAILIQRSNYAIYKNTPPVFVDIPARILGVAVSSCRAQFLSGHLVCSIFRCEEFRHGSTHEVDFRVAQDALYAWVPAQDRASCT